jgi:hypothetical protein
MLLDLQSIRDEKKEEEKEVIIQEQLHQQGQD